MYKTRVGPFYELKMALDILTQLITKLNFSGDSYILDKIHAIEFSHLYEAFLFQNPKAYQNSCEYKNILSQLESMRIESADQTIRCQLIDQFIVRLIAKRSEFLKLDIPQNLPTDTQTPRDILVQLFSFLKINDLLTAALVCKKWHYATNSAKLWDDLIVPKYRGKFAKQLFFKCPYTRISAYAEASERHFFQLMFRLANEHRAGCLSIHQNNPNPIMSGGMLSTWDQYKLESGITLDDNINEEAIFQEIENIIRFGGKLSVNQHCRIVYHYGTPLNFAMITRNMCLVKLLVELGAQDTVNLLLNGIKNPEFFAYGLDLCPEYFENKVKGKRRVFRCGFSSKFDRQSE